MMETRILVVEDEPNLVAFIKKGLEEYDFVVEAAYDGQIGYSMAIQRPYDLILLDVGLPYMDGVSLCRNLRLAHRQTPILFLSALGTTLDKVSGLDAGADDYLIKPFEFAELLARVRSLLRRSNQRPEAKGVVTVGEISLDLNRKVAVRDGQEISLTAKEYSLLAYFMAHPRRVISRQELAEKVWDLDFDTGTNVVEVYVNFVRKKINPEGKTRYIQTRIGLGYIFSE